MKRRSFIWALMTGLVGLFRSGKCRAESAVPVYAALYFEDVEAAVRKDKNVFAELFDSSFNSLRFVDAEPGGFYSDILKR